MKWRKLLLNLGFCAVVSSAPAGDTSEAALVILRPETSSFWRTATNSTMMLPVFRPNKASSAKLTVSGVFGHVQTIENITGQFVEVSLPEPTQAVNMPPTENIYDFNLSSTTVLSRRRV